MNDRPAHGIRRLPPRFWIALIVLLLLASAMPQRGSATVVAAPSRAGPSAPADLLASAQRSLSAGQGPSTAARTSGNWSRALIPGSGWDAAMAYDAATNEVVLFQGLWGSTSNSTWTYANGRWTELNLTPSPPTRYGESMVYDAADSELVLFGGLSPAGSYYNDTWVFSGNRWTDLNNTTTGAPPAREYAAVTYDAGSKDVLLFGGTNTVWTSSGCVGKTFQDTWEFSAGKWARAALNVSSLPPARYGAALAYDPNANDSILFGGALYECARNSTLVLGDTWSLSGKRWTNLSPAHPPSPRLRSSFAFSSQEGALILFGGSTGGVPFYLGEGAVNDTWKFQNGSWTSLAVSGPGRWYNSQPFAELPNGALLLFGTPLWAFNQSRWALTGFFPIPEVTWSPLMVDDSTAGFVLFFGGEGVNYQVPTTWAYQLGNWSNLTGLQTASPPLGNGDVIVDDPIDGYVVLFAGGSGTTWIFQHRTWSQLNPSTSPSPRYGAGIAYDGSDGSVMLFGGSDCFPGYWWDECSWYSDAWKFSGGNWSLLSNGSSSGPAGRSYAAMTYDALDDQVVMFGGINCTRGSVDCVALNDTWTYRSGVWRQLPTAARAPPASAGAGATYDAQAGECVVFGGTRVDSSGDFTSGSPGTWAFSNGTWSEVSIPDGQFAPGDSSQPAFAYVPDLGSDLLYQWTGNAWLLRLGAVTNSLSVQVFSSTLQGDAPVTVEFSSGVTGGQGGYGYVWNFGDGASGVQSSANHTYLTPGIYSVTLRVTDAKGDSASAGLSIRVAGAPKIVATVSPVEGTVPLSVTFGAVGANGTPPYSVEWTYGDGDFGTAFNSSHTYFAVGSFNVSVGLTDAVGTVAVAGPWTVTVLPSPAPLTVGVSTSTPWVTLGASVSLHANVSGGSAPFQYSWTNLPPGCSSSDSDALACTPESAGTFGIHLLVSDAAHSSASGAATVVVLPTPLSLLVEIAPIPAYIGTTVSIVATVAGGTAPIALRWSGLPSGCRGDGNWTQTCVVASSGVFTVGVVATDSAGQTRYSNATEVVLAQPANGSSTPGSPTSPAELASYVVLGAAVGAALTFALAVVLFRRNPPK